MPRIHVLVKDYGREGLEIVGVTTKDEIAQAWESGDAANRRVEADTEASIEPSGIPVSEKI